MNVISLIKVFSTLQQQKKATFDNISECDNVCISSQSHFDEAILTHTSAKKFPTFEIIRMSGSKYLQVPFGPKEIEHKTKYSSICSFFCSGWFNRGYKQINVTCLS